MLARFVQSAETIVRQLDSAAAISSHRWPLVPELRVLELQRLDVRAIAAGYGEDGVRVDELTAGTLEHLEPAVRAHDAGDLDPWRRSREEVRGIVAGLRDLLVEPQLDGGVETRAAPAGPPTTTPTPAPVQANVDGGRKGKKGDSDPPGPRGRPRKAAGATKKAEAAWWRDRAHLEPAIGDQAEDVTLDQLFKRMMEHEFEIHLHQLGAEDLPAWWPAGSDRRPVRVVRFREQWKTTKSTTWAKYVQRVDNDAARASRVAPRHHQGNVEPQTAKETEKRMRLTTADAAIRALEDAAEIASNLVMTNGSGRGKILDDLRRRLARLGIIGPDADELLDREPAEMAAELEKRRRLVEKAQDGTKTRR